MTDNSVEVVERCWQAFHESDKPAPYNRLKDALAALRPGDRLPGGLEIRRSLTDAMSQKGGEAIGQILDAFDRGDNIDVISAAQTIYRAMIEAGDGK